MTTIVEFLTARLDEDEHFARAVEHAVGPDYDQLMVAAGETLELQMVSLYWRRHDPARVLAEVAAKRWMLAAYERCVKDVDARPPVSGSASQMQILWHLMRQIAAPYADHPDYKAKWGLT